MYISAVFAVFLLLYFSVDYNEMGIGIEMREDAEEGAGLRQLCKDGLMRVKRFFASPDDPGFCFAMI